jgi:hypothetical protein
MGIRLFEDVMLEYESDSAAYAGQFAQARDLTRRASESALRTNGRERAAAYMAEAAMRETLAGNVGLARSQAQAALALAEGKDVEGIAAIALALAGEAAHAMKLAGNLNQHFPDDAIVQFDYVPMIHAAVSFGVSHG